MRFAEIALLALPFVVFVAWRMLAPAAGPPRVLVLSVTVTVVVMAGVLLGFWYEEAEPPGTLYVPAQLQDGRIVPGRVESNTPGRVESNTPGRVEPSTPGRVEPSTPGQAASPSPARHPGHD